MLPAKINEHWHVSGIKNELKIENIRDSASMLPAKINEHWHVSGIKNELKIENWK